MSTTSVKNEVTLPRPDTKTKKDGSSKGRKPLQLLNKQVQNSSNKAKSGKGFVVYEDSKEQVKPKSKPTKNVANAEVQTDIGTEKMHQDPNFWYMVTADYKKQCQDLEQDKHELELKLRELEVENVQLRQNLEQQEELWETIAEQKAEIEALENRIKALADELKDTN